MERAERNEHLAQKASGEIAKPRPSVIACDKREAFAQGSEATKQSTLALRSHGLLRLRSQ